MDKGNYETYEYPPVNESESEPDQFFIVQDNGTFLITNREVQYVTQVQNAKDTLEPSQPSNVYDVVPQQFLVDVDNDSELISVSDQYVTEAQSNLFSNSYLLQPEAATATEPMEHTIAESVDEVAETGKQSGSCTEITLSDEQYQMLEQKGWLLLEIGDKIYVLNTLGLHDITTNNKLIEKLRHESQSNASQDINIGTCNLENDATMIFQPDQKDFQSLPGPMEEPEKIMKENDSSVDVSSIQNRSVLIGSKDNVAVKEEQPVTSTETIMINKDSPADLEQDTEMNTRILVIENEKIRREGNTLKVKTKLSLKDFPDKIVLGKTSNGKRLVAKVLKQNTEADFQPLESHKEKPEDSAVLISLSAPYKSTDESEFYMLLQHLFRNNVYKNKCTADDVVTADSVISQLLHIPAFKPSLIDNDLIITKVLQKVDSSGKVLNKSLAAVVTGKVSQIAEEWRFIHLPHMLQKMLNDTEEIVSNYKKNGSANNFIVKDDFSVLHVQITESKEAPTGVVRISVTVNKRNIPIQLITNRIQQQPNKMYACSACAAVFGTELELKDHQADHSLEAEDMLTIDIDQSSKASNYCIVDTAKGKSYTCMLCYETFTRLATCKNHLKTHYFLEKNESAQDDNKTKAIYKCNMCTCTYFHPSTLSKHILSRHINKGALLNDNNYLNQ
ncbi:hypothetical protein ABMA28_005173 [Loxostege sticticalis]|uniref:C2H2-type domain-containing protein n=1 Tax=Loxostege sticticalis TaxID=481309 RepID=A0ABD0SQ52_LOXSC